MDKIADSTGCQLANLERNYLHLKEFCQAQGIELFGVADISAIKNDFYISLAVLEKFDKAVSLGLRLSQSILEEIADSPTRMYFHHYRTVNAALDQISLKVANYIQNKGYAAFPVPASIILDWQTQKAHLSHKKIGFLAGLGWIGRNNMLVNKKLGSQFRLASILTDMPLKIDKPSGDNCADCHACIPVCPARAIKDDPAEFDHIRCYEKLKEFQRQKLADQYICGVCTKICKGMKE
ncbi:MAG: hypothetical protein NC923_01525 [Candidatus Omnitrophica bacterium]|nr:hypothetical protein [Candidatus Omnitrophota bacterium]